MLILAADTFESSSKALHICKIKCNSCAILHNKKYSERVIKYTLII